jgi:dTDP-4-amino-4,6-dideoxygalactose transaminase
MKLTEFSIAYRDAVSQKYFQLLGNKESVHVPRSRLDGRLGVLRFPVLLKNPTRRLSIVNASNTKGWGISSMYSGPLSYIPEIAGSSEKRYITADYIASSIVTLPIHRYVAFGSSRNRLIEQICDGL